MKREVAVETSGDTDRKQLNDVTNKTDKSAGINVKTYVQPVKKSIDMVRKDLFVLSLPACNKTP